MNILSKNIFVVACFILLMMTTCNSPQPIYSLDKVPFISTVYRSVKQIVETFGKENRAVFKEVVLIEYPRADCFVLGFLTNEASGETVEVIGKPLTNVFVPTTPNPTSGFLLMLPPEDIYPLRMSVGDGMKMLISGGAVIPSHEVEKLKREQKKKFEIFYKDYIVFIWIYRFVKIGSYMFL